MALDRYGRTIRYLRISLTDHCNLRCLYCMPEDITFLPKPQLMQDDEILFFVRLFANLGFDKIRLTGGEPTVRANFVELVQEIGKIPGIHSLSMTTNGTLLARIANQLARAGMRRVNISIDTLNPQKFRRLTRWGKLDNVWAGIIAAEEAGMVPVKLNCVVVRGYNENEVVKLAQLTYDHPWHIRFIEKMPFHGSNQLEDLQAVTVTEIKRRISDDLGSLEKVNAGNTDGATELFHLPGAQGIIGFIPSVSEPFCASCTRARLTADGRLRLCLLRDGEVDLLTPLREGASKENLRHLILNGIWNKPWGHGLQEGVIPLNRRMSEIGG